MPAYVIAHLQDAAPHPEIAEYIERLPGTLEPFGGRYLVHGTQHETKEGSWPGAVVIIGFPGIAPVRFRQMSDTGGVVSYMCRVTSGFGLRSVAVG